VERTLLPAAFDVDLAFDLASEVAGIPAASPTVKEQRFSAA